MLHLCIRGVTGILDHEDVEYIETEKLFLGTSGLLYILPVMKMPEENEDIDNEEEEVSIQWFHFYGAFFCFL